MDRDQKAAEAAGTFYEMGIPEHEISRARRKASLLAILLFGPPLLLFSSIIVNAIYPNFVNLRLVLCLVIPGVLFASICYYRLILGSWSGSMSGKAQRRD